MVLHPTFPPPVTSCSRLLPGLYVVEQVLPAVGDVLQLVVDLRLFRLVAGSDELLSKLLQMCFILTEQVDLLHAILFEGQERDKYPF